jgi:SNF2 family DNA or RNA helicase
LTTFQTAAHARATLARRTFSLLVADEAHLMKNAATRISCAVKSLRPQFRMALSGTPVENRLEDLRSLFDFILPGYLGDAATFRANFRHPIEALHDAAKAEELRRITSPFLLRRVKTDRAVIRDLPEKIAANEYAVLEKEQAALYQGLVSETLARSAQMKDAAARSALVLHLLTGLKQICGHPRVFDKQSPAHSALSGKAQLLLALLKEIIDGTDEKVLIFSQYVETLACLKIIIENELKAPALLYHGGLSQAERAEVVDSFQNGDADGSRILLISLRAGGLGLNLTAASRVVHYDLWYNPAVENQATDRAFRIGQKRTVFVHRLITKNTFEEKIDEMLEAKRKLAGLAVGAGETNLAKLSHEELSALFER